MNLTPLTKHANCPHRRLAGLLAASALLVFSVGCASSHSIKYKTTKTDTWQGQPVAGVLRVMPLVDETTPLTEKSFHNGPYLYRQNYRDGYKKDEIANGVTEMMIQHLRKSGMFKDVVGQTSPATADWELSGAIGTYAAKARVNKGAETTANTCVAIGCVFVPIGPLVGNLIAQGITAGQKSEVQAEVTLREMTLKPAGTDTVLWHNTINVSTNFVGHWSAAYAGAFIHPDACLRTAINEMMRQMGAALPAPSANSAAQAMSKQD